jgi:LacI family transcriptional regulator
MSSSGKKDSESSQSGFPKRVTVRDIANELGIHFTTVAEGLRGSSRVKESTRKLIEETAERMGYRVDPLLSALSAYRSSRGRRAFQGSIAWLNAFPDPHYFRRAKYFHGDCYRGAQERAQSLGYKLEEFFLDEEEMSARRASQILESRNTLGLIVGPVPEIRQGIDLDWNRFNSVRIGHSFADRRITNIIADQYGNTVSSFGRLVEAGFQRIGFACPRNLDNLVGNKFSAAYLAMAYRHLGCVEIPPFLDLNQGGDPKAFLCWVREHTPEVIMVGGRSIYYRILLDAGYRVPEDFQLVSLHAEHLSTPMAGMSQNGIAVGSVAVDYIVSMIHSFQVGLEAIPKTTTIPGKWQDGESFNPALRKRSEEG